ncbi:MAG: Branched-chain amino acid transporter permease [Ramlibacter sp.]|jgi:urea ABC transporter permease protein UrtB|nr:Branched-chain amino acid transporter permease [Ramlibacter sp.]
MEYLVFPFHLLYAVALLVLTSLGLAIVFGMMRVVNFAHGEFLMIGGYALILSVEVGVNIWVAMFVVAPLVVGLVGYALERLIIRHLYGRMLDTILATWGVSLALIGAATMVFGFQQRGVPSPLGSFQLGGYRDSWYSVLVIVVSAVLLGGTWWLLRRTRAGLLARGTMQNAQMAEALGMNTSRVYAWTFAAGAAVSGVAGAVLAPLTGAVPTIGTAYVTRAFITVITGGANALTGTLVASSIFGTLSEVVTRWYTPVAGHVALLVAAVVLLRVMPSGITGRFFRRSL